MLACELRLAGVRPLVLERQPQIRDIPKAGGLSRQILQLLRYRGALERFEAASTGPRPAPRFPFGGMHVDFTQLADSPMQALPLPQPLLERVLDEHARELGAEIRRGHEVFQFEWKKQAFNDALYKIYCYRSAALHEAKPSPPPMCMPPVVVPTEAGGEVHSEKPVGLATSTLGGTWAASDTQMTLSLFQYVVRGALLKWWQSGCSTEQGL